MAQAYADVAEEAFPVKAAAPQGFFATSLNRPQRAEDCLLTGSKCVSYTHVDDTLVLSADEQVAAVRQELELERDGRAGLEFQLSQAFEAKARAKEQSVELVRPTPPVSRSRSRGGAHPLS